MEEGSEVTMTRERESTPLGRVRDLVEPIVADLGLEIYDLEMPSGVVRLTVDTPAGGPSGVSLDDIALLTRLVSRELDHADPVPGRYTLEVTSPGLERPLRSPQHFAREAGKTITVKTVAGTEGERRVQGVLEAVDDAGFVVRMADGTVRALRYAEVERARTVFEWGPAPKPGRGRKKGDGT